MIAEVALRGHRAPPRRGGAAVGAALAVALFARPCRAGASPIANEHDQYFYDPATNRLSTATTMVPLPTDLLK